MAKTELYGLINQGPWKEANNFVTHDNSAGTGGNVGSPTLVYNANPTALTVPNDAVELMLYTNNALRVSEDEDLDTYFVLPAGGTVTVNVAKMQYVYLQGDAANCIVQFMFSEI